MTSKLLFKTLLRSRTYGLRAKGGARSP
jgi:hypothetical protein